jgi:hypothetical protein
MAPSITRLHSEMAETPRHTQAPARVGAALFGKNFKTPAKLLYDTTVYIDILQGHFPADGAPL